MTSHVNDVLEAVQSFIAKGYDREYRVKDGNLVDLELRIYPRFAHHSRRRGVAS